MNRRSRTVKTRCLSLDLRCQDGPDGLSTLSSVGLVFADLPSGSTRAQCDRPIDLKRFWASVDRCLLPNGNVVLMASDFRYAATVVESRPDWFRYEIVWRKGRAGGFLNAKRRPLVAHEYVLVFYPNPSRATFNPQRTDGHEPIHDARQCGAGKNYGVLRGGMQSHAGSTVRHPVSVLATKCVATNAKDRIHPQQKPPELLRPLVRTYSNEGDLVVDPCAGSASMGRAVLAEGRRFVGFEIDASMVALALEIG